MAGRLADVINCDNFFGNQFRGLDSVGGQSSPFPIDLAGRRYHSAEATAQNVISITGSAVALHCINGDITCCAVASALC